MVKPAPVKSLPIRISPMPIVQLGNPILWTVAKPVPKNADIDHLISRMSKTLTRAQGVGLAAPQVGQSVRMFLMDIHPTKTRSTLPQIGQIAVINPKVIDMSDEQVIDWEGCLSVTTPQGLVFGPVARPRSILVSFRNQNNKIVKMEMSDLIARIFLHEYDHLDGVLFLQRMTDLSKLVDERAYMNHLKSGTK
ncbi:MAG: peptide deformylase [Candidatus Roizmanbacteria bacterium]